MAFRIYIDESGTHGEAWLIIGMLFVPDHGALHSELCRVKEDLQYFNTSPKRSAKYRETHYAEFRSPADVTVSKAWVDLFVKHACYYRCIVIDWSMWDGSHFGDPFEPDALKRRRAYKKWAEMLLHPELKQPALGSPIYHAELYLDRLKIMYGYDVIDHLEDRFTRNYQGLSPHVQKFQHTDSWRDANQCLQLCDVLTGGMYQVLVPSRKTAKLQVRDYLAASLQSVGVKEMRPGYWRQFAPVTLSKHFPKYSAWFWNPLSKRERKQRNRRQQ